MTRGTGPAPHGFPREARLRKRRELLSVQGNGRRHFTRHFIVFVRGGQSVRPRIGITASKRVGKAVVRNRWKRIIREAFRQLELAATVDVVVIARSGVGPPDLRQAQRELGGVLSARGGPGRHTARRS